MISLLVASSLAHAAPVLAQPTLTRGLDTTFVVTGAAANSTVYFVTSSTGIGPGQCFPALQNLCLDLQDPPILLGTSHADATGRAELVATVPPSMLPGVTLYFQAVQAGNPAAKSGTRTATVQEIPLGAPYCDDPGPDEKVVHLLNPVVTTFEGYTLKYYVPSNPQGMIFYFHGGATASSEVAQDEEYAFLWNLMGAKEHYAIVSTERTAPGAGGAWDATTAPATNQDMQRMNRLRTWMINNTAVDSTTRVSFNGFSDGAIFATTFGYQADVYFHWPMQAVIANNGANRTTVPRVATQFWVAANDDQGAVSNLSSMVADLQQNGVPVDSIHYPERLTTPTSFMRHGWVDSGTSQDFYDELLADGLITAGGARNVPVSQIDQSLSDFVANGTVGGEEVVDGIEHVLWATHRYSAHDANRMCNWIRNH